MTGTTLADPAVTPADMGRRFERLMCRIFEAHPHEYGPDRFERVWLWMDWPDRAALGYGADIGIDIVAEQTAAYGGGLCAIQCKHYAPDHKVPTSGVDSFLAASSNPIFTSRILVVTSDLERAGWTKTDKASPRCEVVGPARLADIAGDWSDHLNNPATLSFETLERHTPRPDQRDALNAVSKGYQNHSRGRLVMPCGTGKSLVAMWAAEENVADGGQVLYLVPSIALMGQTMREWARHRTRAHAYIGVCSDKTTGRVGRDTARDLTELAMPVTTDTESIAAALNQPTIESGLRVVFCTYQSLPTLTASLPDEAMFDLVICDEAHRTTGVDKPTDDEVSAFRLVHDTDALPAGFRLFMTATQRIYTAAAKHKAALSDSDIYSMDDETVYGPLLYEMTFKDAVDAGLLSDYEVLIVAASQSRFTTAMGDLLTQVNKGAARQAVTKADAVKLLGCWDALADPNTTGVAEGRPTGARAPTPTDDRRAGHLQTAIAFTNTVNLSKAVAGATGETAGLWQGVIAEAANGHTDDLLDLSVEHVDGSTPAVRRATSLDTLRSEPSPGACRVISNARVLTEGVDVPALDAVVFLQPRKSKIDIVQAVGRVMRTYPGKRKGYIVIPVVVPDGGSANDAKVLAGSDFSTVWDVVRALRSHDERMDMWVNHIDAARHNIPVTIIDRETDDPLEDTTEPLEQLRLLLDEKVASKLVDMCGDRRMWPAWGAKAAAVCADVRRQVDVRLTQPATAQAFTQFADALRAAVGGHLTNDQAAEMLAQHVVTIPIFDCLFNDSTFAAANPISQAMNSMLTHLRTLTDPADEPLFAEELRPLTRAYTTMQTVFAGALTPAAKADVLREIYDGFFHAAMKDAVTRLGIVYTPVEIVDFIIRSADAVCRAEFGVGLTAENVNILDPFTGTGTFIYRPLTAADSNGNPIIRDEDLRRKYYSELFANELVLLAYYIAAIKIEAGMAERGGFGVAAFEPFPGVTLGDTFHTSLAAAGGGAGLQLPGIARNQQRTSRQGAVPITVICSNPPWSAGQKSTGDDNPNVGYPHIEQRVRGTYGRKHREVTGRGAGKSSGNLYVQAIRWASDRLGEPDTLAGRGVIVMVHPNSLANGTSLAGMRAALRDEFTDIYIVDLRSDQYKSGDERLIEGAVIFEASGGGGGSRSGVQITVLVRNPDKRRPNGAVVHYAAVPEYSNLKAKFQWLADLSDVTNDQLTPVQRNTAHDWVNLTDSSYMRLMRVCATSREPQDKLLTHVSAGGVMTACDAYVYAFGYDDLVGIPPNRGDIVYEETLCHTHDASTTRSSGPALCGSSGRREGRSLRSPASSGSARGFWGTGSARTASSGAGPRASALTREPSSPGCAAAAPNWRWSVMCSNDRWFSGSRRQRDDSGVHRGPEDRPRRASRGRLPCARRCRVDVLQVAGQAPDAGAAAQVRPRRGSQGLLRCLGGHLRLAPGARPAAPRRPGRVQEDRGVLHGPPGPSRTPAQTAAAGPDPPRQGRGCGA